MVHYGTDLAASPEADLNIPVLYMHGGTFNWYPDDSGDPTITAAWIFSGRFNANASTNDNRDKTITTIYTFAGATINIANSKGNITITNWYDYGANITVDSHAEITLAYNQP